VLIWTGLAGGDSEYCAILVAINSILQMVLFAPLALLFIVAISGDPHGYDVDYNFVAKSVGVLLSLIGLLFTILILFASQGRQVVHQIVSVVRVAAPLVVYFSIMFGTTLLVTRRLGFGYKLSCTQSFTAASNNFELAIAVAVAIFGIDSDQALAATVGPLIEVPVLLALVYVVKWYGKRKDWKA